MEAFGDSFALYRTEVKVSMEFVTIPFNLRILNANGEIEYVTDHLGDLARLGRPHLRAYRNSANLLRLCGHGAYVASVAVLREIPQDRPDDGHITSCSLALLRSSENVLTVLDRCAVADAPPANTPDHDRIGQRPPVFPGNR
jgi:hypothetical protein